MAMLQPYRAPALFVNEETGYYVMFPSEVIECIGNQMATAHRCKVIKKCAARPWFFCLAPYNAMSAMEELYLKNGIIIKIEDKTVTLSGDLYLKQLEITYAAPLGKEGVELLSYCGEHIVQLRRIERPAVHLSRIEEIKHTLKKSSLRTTIPYMEHAKFLPRLKESTLQAYRERQEKDRKMLETGLKQEQ
jgi:hypothetical protein